MSLGRQELKTEKRQARSAHSWESAFKKTHHKTVQPNLLVKKKKERMKEKKGNKMAESKTKGTTEKK